MKKLHYTTKEINMQEANYKTDVRVWDKTEKKMVFVGKPIGSGGDILIGIDDGRNIVIGNLLYPSQAIGFWQDERFVAMDCTDETDKQIVTIYAGDILEDKNKNQWAVVRKSDDKTIFLIQNLTIPTKLYILSSLEPNKNLTIIGNVYENPKLAERIARA